MSEQSEEQEIYVAIPPPLVSPLVRQLDSGHDSAGTHLPTPISTNNSSFAVSQSFAQSSTLDAQYQRSMLASLPGGGSGSGSGGYGNNFSLSGSGIRPESGLSSPESRLQQLLLQQQQQQQQHDSNTNTRSPVSSTLPAQLMNRLYSFSAAINPSSSDVSLASQQGTASSSRPGIVTSLGITSPSFFSSSPVSGTAGGSSNSNDNNNSNPNSRSSTQFQSQSYLPEMYRSTGPISPMTESTRAAAATAIANTLTRGEVRPSRGESPYIPSSLSMLFSDPEVMQLQEEVERAQMYQHQLRMRQRYLDSKRSFSGDTGRSNERQGTIEGRDDNDLIDGVIDEDDEDGDDDGEYDDDDDDDDDCISSPVTREDQQLLGSGQGNMPFGYEMVQDEQHDDVYHPYATVMSRSDYLAPHEPSSSSPLFPSPLTTLGSFTPLSDQLEEQHVQAGRTRQGYGTMDNSVSNNSNSSINMVYGRMDMPTPSNLSHAAYYHSVSNYHYSSQDGNQIGSDGSRTGGGGSSSSSSLPTPCVPGNPEWRRHRGRDNSYQSYTSIGANGNNSNNNHRNRRSCFRCLRDNPLGDNLLCGGILSSFLSNWICCESSTICCLGCC